MAGNRNERISAGLQRHHLSKANLASARPDIAAEWHPTLNEDLRPDSVHPGTPRSVWWQCSKNPHHVWRAQVRSRTRSGGSGCPHCAGKARCPAPGESLADLHPKIAAQWDGHLNKEKRPSDVSPGSSFEAWWRCDVDPAHVWRASVASRVRGRGCGVCAGKQVTNSNSLARLRPDLATQWHPSRNGALGPEQVTVFSGRKVWWLCPVADDHEWTASVSSRSAGNGCPCCAGFKVADSNRLSIQRPDIAAQWHPTLNGELTPDQVTVGTSTRVWWQCAEGADHVWRTTVVKRTRDGRGCPACAGSQVADSNRLSIQRPDIAAQWHPTLNGELTPADVAIGSTKRVWWKCAEGDDHVWSTTVVRRTWGLGSGCPCCAGFQLADSNRLSVQRPDIAAQWNTDRNGTLTPADVTVGSERRAWWRCPDNPVHEWQAVVKSRTTLGAGCPKCSIAHESAREVRIRHELAAVLGFAPDVVHLRLNGKRIAVDMAAEHLRLIVEYDGSYWHQSKVHKDREKTELLIRNGWRVVRLREEPLELLSDDDLPVQASTPVKAVVDQVLRRLVEMGLVEQTTIDGYLAADEEIAAGAASAYLTGKRKARRK